MIKMTQKDWDELKPIFSINENWGDPFKMSIILITTLYNLRRFVNKPIHIHCGYEKRGTGGLHPRGMAVDFHIKDMHVIDQFIAASRFDEFNGIGLYSWWNNPGLHVDVRTKSQKYFEDSRWGCKSAGVYASLDYDFIKSIL